VVGMATLVSSRRYWPRFSFLLVWTAISPAMGGDRPEFTYRTNATEVRLNFSATDQNNNAVATLQASDFAVVDKDVIVRKFQSFTRSDWTKLELAVLVDTSESVSPRFRQEMTDALELVSRAGGIPEENLSMFSFSGTQPAQLCAGNCRSSHALDRLPGERTRGLTPLFDTITLAANFLAKQGGPHAEKVLIVFSDGLDTASRSSMGNAINASLRGEVQLDCIDLNKPADNLQGASVLRTMASATGGRYFPLNGGANQALNVILEGFRASYAVTYRLPSHTYGFHEVRILPTHNLNLQFRSRSGYYYPNQVQ
jgi:VWFA-related protein